MVFNRYYQDELAYFRDLGQEFAQSHPSIAPMLAGPGSDPDVERLLEGVAFLTAKLRLKLDDELPEVLHSLMEILWPHYLKPVPSITTVEFKPAPQLNEAVKIPEGTSLDSTPAEGTTCRFRTCTPVNIWPLYLEDAGFEERSSARSRMVLTFASSSVNLSEIAALDETLSLHLHGDYGIMASLYMMFLRELKEVYLEDPEDGKTVALDPGRSVRPLGFTDGYGLLPFPPETFEGYKFLLEYFLYPSRFLNLGLDGLSALAGFKGNRFSVHFVFGKDFSHAGQIRRGNIRLFTTTAINIFRHEADPLRIDPEKVEYLIRPTGQHRHHYAVYSIEEMVGWVPGTVERHSYHPVFSFTPPKDKNTRGFYQIMVRPAVSWEGVESYVSFLNLSHKPENPDVKIVSPSLLCTNANLPAALQAGDIRLPTADTPEMVTFKNITKPTQSIWPPIEQGVLWRLTSHLSLNYLSLSKVEYLRHLLSLYNFHNFGDRNLATANELKIKGIKALSTKQARMLFRGQPLSGLDIKIEVSGKNFAGPGDLFIFGQVLNEFFSLYCNINTFSRLTLKETDQGQELTWPARLGRRPLL